MANMNSKKKRRLGNCLAKLRPPLRRRSRSAGIHRINPKHLGQLKASEISLRVEHPSDVTPCGRKGTFERAATATADRLRHL